MAELELRNLEKRYPNDTFAVKGVSFAASDGEFVVLVGPSGCGKSTTLRMIAGLEEITGGDLFIGGKRMNDEEPKDRDIAMVFQNYALYPHLSVFDNLAFPLRMRKVSKPEIRRQVEAAAETLSITHLLQRKPKELSGGERQRVAVGRAIVRKPKVFLFDEPLSNLDAALRTQMRAELKRLQRRLGATMIYVTHDQVEAMTMGDRIVVMNKGLVEQVGTPAEIYARPETVFVARFLGSPPMNMISGMATEDNGSLVLNHESKFSISLAWQPNLNGRNIVVAIRPESVKIVAKGTPGSLTGKLALVEPVGSQTHIYIELAAAQGGTITATLSESNQLSPPTFSLGDTIHFTLPTDSMHLFDRASGKRIS